MVIKIRIYHLLLCYYFFSAFYIQITSYFLTIIGIILTKIGVHKMPFKKNFDIYEIFFNINIPYFLFIIFFKVIFLIFRCIDVMNNDLNLWGYGLSIIEIYVSAFGIVTNIINDSMIWYNIYFEKGSKNNITNEELKNMKIYLLSIIFIWINILFLSITDNVLINLKINDSYYHYNKSKKTEIKISTNLKLEEERKKPKLINIITKITDKKKDKNQNNNHIIKPNEIEQSINHIKNNNSQNLSNNIDTITNITNLKNSQNTELMVNEQK